MGILTPLLLILSFYVCFIIVLSHAYSSYFYLSEDKTSVDFKKKKRIFSWGECFLNSGKSRTDLSKSLYFLLCHPQKKLSAGRETQCLVYLGHLGCNIYNDFFEIPKDLLDKKVDEKLISRIENYRKEISEDFMSSSKTKENPKIKIKEKRTIEDVIKEKEEWISAYLEMQDYSEELKEKNDKLKSENSELKNDLFEEKSSCSSLEATVNSLEREVTRLKNSSFFLNADNNELKLKVSVLEENINHLTKTREKFVNLAEQFGLLKKELESTKKELESTKEELESTLGELEEEESKVNRGERSVLVYFLSNNILAPYHSEIETILIGLYDEEIKNKFFDRLKDENFIRENKLHGWEERLKEWNDSRLMALVRSKDQMFANY